MAVWQLQEAKSQFSELVKRAMNDGPQNVTVRGEPSVVVISCEDFQSLSQQKPSFLDMMQSAPFTDKELNFERDQSLTRKVKL